MRTIAPSTRPPATRLTGGCLEGVAVTCLPLSQLQFGRRITVSKGDCRHTRARLVHLALENPRQAAPLGMVAAAPGTTSRNGAHTAQSTVHALAWEATGLQCKYHISR